MTLRRTLTAALVLVVASLLLVACGGTSKADYEKQVTKIGNTVDEDLNKLDEGEPSVESIEAAQKSLKDAASELDDIDPPSEVSDLHDDLVKVLEDTAELFGTMAPLMQQAADDPSSLGEEELNTMQSVQGDFADIEKRMNAVEEGFKDKDYEIGLDADSSSDDSEE